MNINHRRLAAGFGLPLVALAAVAVALIATTGSLPDPLATHWGFDGEPDDSTGRATFVAIFLGLNVVLAVTVAASARRQGDTTAPAVSITTFIQWVITGATVATLVANNDAETWESADELPLYFAVLIPAFAAGAAMTASILMGPLVPHPSGADKSSVQTRGSERIAWFGSVRATWPLALGGAIGAVGVGILLSGNRALGGGLVLAAVIVAWLSVVQVQADRRGLTVRYGPIAWPSTRIALERIERAEAIEMQPMKHGGWGYRGSVRVFGRAAVVLRAGDGLQLELTGGKKFAITVDDADTAAGTLNELVAARSEAMSGRDR